MKQTSLLWLTLIFCSTSLLAQDLIHSYAFEKPFVLNKNGEQFIQFKECKLSGKPGEPSLPWYPVKLALPVGSKVKSINFILEEEKLMNENILIAPQQYSRPLSEKKSFNRIKNEKHYQTDQFLPIESNTAYKISYMHGYPVLLSSFTPIKYNPKSRITKYYSKVTLHIELEKTKTNKQVFLSDNQIKQLKNLIQNKNEIEFNIRNTKSDYQYLIIAPNTFTETLLDLKNYYNSTGLNTNIKSVEEISEEVTGNDLQEKIRKYIISEYQNSAIEFVLLAGDVEHIPARGFYTLVHSSSDYTDNNIPADLYYAALDGSWNNDNDELWGEPGEDDLLPEIAIGRFPASTVDELENMIHKSISYQSTPVEIEMDKSLLAGEHLWNDPETWGAQYLDLLIDTQTENGYNTTGIPSSYPIQKMYEKNLGEWTGEQLITELGKGYSFIHHVGHAFAQYVAHLYNEDITNENFAEIDGIQHNFPLFYTHGCICGAFDEADCIGERMVSIDNFASAFIGNSRYGWFNEGQTEGPAAHLHREFVNALYTDKVEYLGMALATAKTETAPWVTAPNQHEEGALRWNFYDLNVLGDPAMKVRTDKTSSINHLETENFISHIYPNPANKQIALEINTSMNTEGNICLIELSGKKVYSETKKINAGRFTWTLNTEQIDKGVYFIQLKINNQTEIRKFIKR